MLNDQQIVALKNTLRSLHPPLPVDKRLSFNRVLAESNHKRCVLVLLLSLFLSSFFFLLAWLFPSVLVFNHPAAPVLYGSLLLLTFLMYTFLVITHSGNIRKWICFSFPLFLFLWGSLFFVFQFRAGSSLFVYPILLFGVFSLFYSTVKQAVFYIFFAACCLLLGFYWMNFSPLEIGLQLRLLIPVMLVSFFVSRVLYASKVHEFLSRLEVDTLNASLHYANQLMKDRMSMTDKELLVAKEKAEESNRLKSAFLQNLSHEIRTPMNSIVGFSQLMVQPELQSEDILSYANIVVDGTRQLLTMVDNTVMMSSIQTHQVEVHKASFSVSFLVTRLEETYRYQLQKKHITFFPNVEVSQDTLHTDFDLLFIVLEKLMDNAIKFTHGGTITLQVRNLDSMFHVELHDTGQGIGAENSNEIFDVFWQGSRNENQAINGIGLGLPIARGLVQLLGGKLDYCDTPTKGSCFFFTLPM